MLINLFLLDILHYFKKVFLRLNYSAINSLLGDDCKNITDKSYVLPWPSGSGG